MEEVHHWAHPLLQQRYRDVGQEAFLCPDAAEAEPGQDQLLAAPQEPGMAFTKLLAIVIWVGGAFPQKRSGVYMLF